jgi:hypothetical protein
MIGMTALETLARRSSEFWSSSSISFQVVQRTYPCNLKL